MRRTEVSPAFVGSMAFHGAILAALLISLRFTHELKIGSSVPVTIVANAPDTDLRAAEQAPVEQAAQTEAPAPEAPPQAAAQPQPVPTPPTPTKTQKPPEKLAPQKPAPTAKPEKSLDLDALAASIPTPKTAAKPSSAAKGPARPETALQARPALGTGNSAAAMNGFVEELERRWNPNCEVQGGRDVMVKVTFQIDGGGGVSGQPTTQITRGQGAVADAGARRAVSAVFAASPFRSLPREYYGQRISVNFDAHSACS